MYIQSNPFNSNSLGTEEKVRIKRAYEFQNKKFKQLYSNLE